MPNVTLAELSKGKAGVSPSGGLWTPGSIKEIITAITDLLKQAKLLQGNSGGDQSVMSSRPDVLGPGAQPAQAQQTAITMPQLLSLGKQLCDQLMTQGFADSTIIEVLQKTPYTIKQIRELLP